MTKFEGQVQGYIKVAISLFAEFIPLLAEFIPLFAEFIPLFAEFIPLLRDVDSHARYNAH